MTNSEPNVTSDLDDLVSESLRGLSLLGFAHPGTLTAMRGVSPVPASFARRLLSSSARAPVRLPRGFPPTPKPRLVSQPQTEPHGPLLAAAPSAAAISTRRSALTRPRSRESERTPNHALQRTGVAVTLAADSGPNPSRPTVALSYARCLFLRLTTQPSRQPRPSLSLGSLGVATRLV